MYGIKSLHGHKEVVVPKFLGSFNLELEIQQETR